jgi:hypothetical protein
MVTVGAFAIAAGVFVAGVTSGATGQAFPLVAGPIFLLIFPRRSNRTHRDVLAHGATVKRRDVMAFDQI